MSKSETLPETPFFITPTEPERESMKMRDWFLIVSAVQYATLKDELRELLESDAETFILTPERPYPVTHVVLRDNSTPSLFEKYLEILRVKLEEMPKVNCRSGYHANKRYNSIEEFIAELNT